MQCRAKTGLATGRTDRTGACGVACKNWRGHNPPKRQARPNECMCARVCGRGKGDDTHFTAFFSPCRPYSPPPPSPPGGGGSCHSQAGRHERAHLTYTSMLPSNSLIACSSVNPTAWRRQRQETQSGQQRLARQQRQRHQAGQQRQRRQDGFHRCMGCGRMVSGQTAERLWAVKGQAHHVAQGVQQCTTPSHTQHERGVWPVQEAASLLRLCVNGNAHCLMPAAQSKSLPPCHHSGSERGVTLEARASMLPMWVTLMGATAWVSHAMQGARRARAPWLKACGS